MKKCTRFNTLLLVFCFLLCTVASCAEETIWICPKCGKENTKNFCGTCGMKRDNWICLNCGEENSDMFCEYCGASKPEENAQNDIDQELTPETEKKVIENVAENNAREISEIVTVKECGFDTFSHYFYYSFIAHNNLKDKAIKLPEFRITLRDKEGSIITTTRQILNVIYPSQDVAYAFQGGECNEDPASIEITFVEPEDDWHIVNPSTLDHKEYKQLEIKNTKPKEKSMVGEIYNPNEYNLNGAAITVLFRNEDGKLRAGNTSFVNTIKAGETIPFEISYLILPQESSYEVYAQPWF